MASVSLAIARNQPALSGEIDGDNPAPIWGRFLNQPQLRLSKP
jgi:hypothetical protein